MKTAIRNQFVIGLADGRIRSRLMEMEKLTLEKAEEIATAMELSEKERVNMASNSVNELSEKPKYRGGYKSKRKPKFGQGGNRGKGSAGSRQSFQNTRARTQLKVRAILEVNLSAIVAAAPNISRLRAR